MSTCSFCGKKQNEVSQMVLGPNNVNICSECVKLCYNLVLNAEAKDSASTNPQPAGPVSDGLDDLYL